MVGLVEDRGEQEAAVRGVRPRPFRDGAQDRDGLRLSAETHQRAGHETSAAGIAAGNGALSEEAKRARELTGLDRGLSQGKPLRRVEGAFGHGGQKERPSRKGSLAVTRGNQRART